MAIVVDGVNITNVTTQKKDFIITVKMNTGQIVWERTLYLDLPQQSKVVNLRTFINSKNSLGYRRIVVTNARTQPRIISGNLSGLIVELVNKGEIQGDAPGRNGLEVSSAMKLTNHGWIRGAGGNGKAGSRGANGANSTKTVSVKKNVSSSWRGGGIWYRPCKYKFVHEPDPKSGCGVYTGVPIGWIAWHNGAQVSGRGGAPSAVNVGGVTLYRSGSVVNSRHENRCCGKPPASVGYASWYNSTKRISITGGKGGAGGAGGRGQYYRHGKTNGSGGSSGGRSSPSGGNSGHRGQTGGNGGTWGNRGGNNGSVGGHAITGFGRLTAGSKRGSVSGSVS